MSPRSVSERRRCLSCSERGIDRWLVLSTGTLYAKKNKGVLQYANTL